MAPDGRDDYTPVFSTGLSIAALGKVAVIAATGCTLTSGKGTTITSGGQTVNVENTVSSNLTSPQHLDIRTGTMFFRLTGLSSAACKNGPFGLAPGTHYNGLGGTGSGDFGSNANTAKSGYSIKLELGDHGDTSQGGDNTKVDTVNFTITKTGTNTVVWSGKGTTMTGDEEESG